MGVPTVADTLEGDIQEALTICGGDAITALRITLIANAFLEAQIDELKEQVSAATPAAGPAHARRTRRGH